MHSYLGGIRRGYLERFGSSNSQAEWKGRLGKEANQIFLGNSRSSVWDIIQYHVQRKYIDIGQVNKVYN